MDISCRANVSSCPVSGLGEIGPDRHCFRPGGAEERWVEGKLVGWAEKGGIKSWRLLLFCFHLHHRALQFLSQNIIALQTSLLTF